MNLSCWDKFLWLSSAWVSILSCISIGSFIFMCFVFSGVCFVFIGLPLFFCVLYKKILKWSINVCNIKYYVII